MGEVQHGDHHVLEELRATPDRVRWRRRAVIAGTHPWSAFGVRDPSLLVDPAGRGVLVDGRHVVYFNARDRAPDHGGVTVVGRATSADGFTWDIDPEPVLSDGDYTAQGSVLQFAPDEHALYYSFDTKLGFRRADSRDGRSWVVRPTTLLAPGDVDCNRIGLPYVTRWDDRWIMVFEGIDRSARFGIYGAISDDGLSWAPWADGRPLLTVAEESWHGLGRANPSLHVVADASGSERCLLLYNGSAALMEWDVGIAHSDRPDGFVALDRPILCRDPAEPWSQTRLEGARPFPSAAEATALLYFGTPDHDPYGGATIGMAEIVFSAG